MEDIASKRLVQLINKYKHITIKHIEEDSDVHYGLLTPYGVTVYLSCEELRMMTPSLWVETLNSLDGLIKGI